jgi:hypothetical protein
VKVLWIVTDEYRGPAIVRGHRLDADGSIRFNATRDERLDIPLETFVRALGVPTTWRLNPSAIRLREPGCFGWQIDGTDFREVVIFQVVDTSAS